MASLDVSLDFFHHDIDNRDIRDSPIRCLGGIRVDRICQCGVLLGSGGIPGVIVNIPHGLNTLMALIRSCTL